MHSPLTPSNFSLDDKVQENRLRRRAKRYGLALKKSRGHLHLDNRGGYMVIDFHRNIIRAGERFDWNLNDVEHYLDQLEGLVPKS